MRLPRRVGRHEIANGRRLFRFRLLRVVFWNASCHLSSSSRASSHRGSRVCGPSGSLICRPRTCMARDRCSTRSWRYCWLRADRNWSAGRIIGGICPGLRFFLRLGWSASLPHGGIRLENTITIRGRFRLEDTISFRGRLFGIRRRPWLNCARSCDGLVKLGRLRLQLRLSLSWRQRLRERRRSRLILYGRHRSYSFGYVLAEVAHRFSLQVREAGKLQFPVQHLRCRAHALVHVPACGRGG